MRPWRIAAMTEVHVGRFNQEQIGGRPRAVRCPPSLYEIVGHVFQPPTASAPTLLALEDLNSSSKLQRVRVTSYHRACSFLMCSLVKSRRCPLPVGASG